MNRASKKRNAPLICAVRNGHHKPVIAQLEANVNATDKSCEIPLILAIQNGNRETVTALLKAGADVNQRMKGNTPLIVASGKPLLIIWVFVINYGANFGKAIKMGSR